jgi:hypothetical protein
MNASSIVTGRIEDAGLRPFEADEFKSFLDRIIAGGAITHDEYTRCTKKQREQLRTGVFLDALDHCNAIFKSGQHRGRRGAAKVLDLCQQIIKLHEPESEGLLFVLDELIRALGQCNERELPELFRPGVDAGDHKKHLSIVSTESGDE